MLIHIFDDTPHHYNPMITFFTEKCTLAEEQMFWVKQQKPDENALSEKITQTYASPSDLMIKLGQLPKSAQVVFHGLMDVPIWRKLVFSSIASRCSCIMWGTELYRHGRANRAFKFYLTQLNHAILVKRFNKVIALNPGDAKLVSSYLKRNDAQVLPYPLIGIKKPESLIASNLEQAPLKILVGNSAADSNEHIYALKQLAHLASDNVEIIVPLNYAGSEFYIKKVIKAGHELFSGKFKPITHMLDKAAYDNLLASVSLSIFAHQRQQGLYIAYSMLLMGKQMFLRQQTSSFSNFKALDFDVYSTESLTDYSFEQLSDLVKVPSEHNSTLMDMHFTEHALAPRWSTFLNGLTAK